MSKVEYFIGGGGDKKDWISGLSGGGTQIMRFVADGRRLKTPKTSSVIYKGHEDEKEVILEIKKKWKSREYTSINLTGHSWGGHAAMNICQALFHARIPVDELITLDPVSLFPFSKIYARKWVNIYITPSFLDSSTGKIPVLGNIINALLTSPTLMTKKGAEGGWIANVGGQLGAENGAYNVKINVSHQDAQAMYDKARKEIVHAKTNPVAIGFR